MNSIWHFIIEHILGWFDPMQREYKKTLKKNKKMSKKA